MEGLHHGDPMTEQSAQQAPAPDWAQAMQGKSKGPLPAASKRIFIIVSMIFFGAFLWLYVIYNLRHSPTSEQKTAAAQAPAAIEMTQGLQPFGMPRGAQPPGSQGQYVPMHGTPVAMQSVPSLMPVAQGLQAAPTQLPGAGLMGEPVPDAAHYQSGYQQPGRQYRSDMAIVAPIRYRHAMSAPGMAAANPSISVPRQRMYASR